MKMQFLIEVDACEHPVLGQVPTVDSVKARLLHDIQGSEGWYAQYDYNTIKVVPLGYQRVFNAIGDATVIRWGAAISISVEKFLASILK